MVFPVQAENARLLSSLVLVRELVTSAATTEERPCVWSEHGCGLLVVLAVLIEERLGLQLRKNHLLSISMVRSSSCSLSSAQQPVQAVSTAYGSIRVY